MIRGLKQFVLVLAAILVVSVVAASAANAASAFTSTNTTTFAGAQSEENVFKTNAGKVKCKKATFSGNATAGKNATTSTTPVYSECLLGGVVPVTVNMNGCTYQLTPGETVVAEKEMKASASILCPAGKSIQILAEETKCEITIGAQKVGSHLLIIITPTPSIIFIWIWTWTLIVYHTNNHCPNGKEETASNGTYEGRVELEPKAGMFGFE